MHIRSLLVAMVVTVCFPTLVHASVESTVRKHFASHPVLIKIAKCESGYQQFETDGRVKKNPNSSAMGVMQIMYSAHHKAATKMGYNIKSTNGNLKYALALYKKEGTKPWKSSKACWG